MNAGESLPGSVSWESRPTLSIFRYRLLMSLNEYVNLEADLLQEENMSFRFVACRGDTLVHLLSLHKECEEVQDNTSNRSSRRTDIYLQILSNDNKDTSVWGSWKYSLFQSS